MKRKWQIRWIKVREQINSVALLVLLLGIAIGFGGYLVVREAFDNGIITGTDMKLKDWATFWLGLLAFLLSMLAFFYNRQKAKRDAFLAIHEKLIALDIQEGRRFLFTKINSEGDAARLKRRNIEAYQKVNRAMSMYDVLGLYVSRRYVDKSVVLEEWGRNLAMARENAEHFMDFRKKRWDHFDKLSSEAHELYGDELERNRQ